MFTNKHVINELIQEKLKRNDIRFLELTNDEPISLLMYEGLNGRMILKVYRVEFDNSRLDINEIVANKIINHHLDLEKQIHPLDLFNINDRVSVNSKLSRFNLSFKGIRENDGNPFIIIYSDSNNLIKEVEIKNHYISVGIINTNDYVIRIIQSILDNEANITKKELVNIPLEDEANRMYFVLGNKVLYIDKKEYELNLLFNQWLWSKERFNGVTFDDYKDGK